MNLGEKIDDLKSKHHDLETAIEEENHRPHPDEIEISSLKKQKLKIKDEIASLDAS
ncbi:MAG: YdcH family protein [Rhodospirillales bacterium]